MSNEHLVASCSSGLSRGYCHFARFPSRNSFWVPLPRQGPACWPLSILLYVSVTTICRRNSDSVAARCREYDVARSVKGPEELLGRFDSPALLARNCFEPGHHGCFVGGCCLRCCSTLDVRNALSCSAGGSRSKSQDRGLLCPILKVQICLRTSHP